MITGSDARDERDRAQFGGCVRALGALTQGPSPARSVEAEVACLCAEQGCRARRVAADPAQCGRDVGRSRKAQETDREVAERCERSRGGVGCPELVAVLIEGPVAYPVDLVLDALVSPDVSPEKLRACRGRRQARHVVRGLVRDEPVCEVRPLPVDGDHLGSVREGEIFRCWCNLDIAVLRATMTSVVVHVLGRESLFGDRLDRGKELRLIVFRLEELVGTLLLDDEARVLPLGVHRIGRDERALEIKRCEQGVSSGLKMTHQ